MPVFSRSSTEPITRGAWLAVIVGTAGLLFFLIVIISGGFLLNVGPLRLSVRRWPGPLAVSLASWGVGLLLCGRRAMQSAAAGLLPFIERRALAIVLVLAASSAGAGIAFGTYAASGADAAGYVSQARLFADGQVSFTQPLIERVGWPDAAWAFSPLGYRPGTGTGEVVPTYPPGLPLAMSPFVAADSTAAFLVVPAFGALVVCAAFALGRRLHSATAGVGAATLMATSPIFLFQLAQPMSDVAVTAWWTLAMVFALSAAPNAALAAGAAGGFAVLTRPNLVPLCGVILILLLATRRLGRTRSVDVLLFSAALCPAVSALLLLQRRQYGSPFASGYGDVSSLFSWSNVIPNAQAYALRLMHGEAGSLLILAAAALALLLARIRSTRPPVTGLTRAAALGALCMVAVLACYLPYGQFSEWFYLRFLLPAFPAAFAFVAAALVCALTVVSPAVRGVTFVALLTLAASVNVVTAARQQAFHLRDFEARYRLAGRYLAASLPPSGVIISTQESASAHYYTRLPIVRWDLLTISLDSAVSDLRSAGHTVVLLIEDWEIPALRARFPASSIARLDWAPRAQVQGSTRVGIFYVADAGARSGPTLNDRIPSRSVPDRLSFGPEDDRDSRRPPPWPER